MNFRKIFFFTNLFFVLPRLKMLCKDFYICCYVHRTSYSHLLDGDQDPGTSPYLFIYLLVYFYLFIYNFLFTYFVIYFVNLCISSFPHLLWHERSAKQFFTLWLPSVTARNSDKGFLSCSQELVLRKTISITSSVHYVCEKLQQFL